MKTNEINENEEVSIDEEEKHDETSNETNRQEEVENEIRNSIANRIRILKMIEKAGHSVPEHRREAMRSSEWGEYSKAEKVEISAFDELDV